MNTIIWTVTIVLLAIFVVLFLIRVLFRKRLLKDVADEAAKQAFNFREFLKMAYPAALVYTFLYVFFLVAVMAYYSDAGDLESIRKAIEDVQDGGMNAAKWMPALLIAFLDLWLIFHIIDIDYRSRNRSIALFFKSVNTNTGVSKWNFVILVFACSILLISLLMLAFTHKYYIALPMFFAIALGTGINIIAGDDADWRVKKPSEQKWKPSDAHKRVRIKAGSQDDSQTTVSVVTGKTPVERVFHWKLKDKWGIDPDSEDVVKVTLYKEDWEEPHPEMRKKNPFYGVSSDGTTMRWVESFGDNLGNAVPVVVKGPDTSSEDSEKRALVAIVDSALDIADKYHLADFEVPELLLTFCQSDEIAYKEDQVSSPINQFIITDENGQPNLEYFRFAAETLYDREGDCDCKSVLAYRLMQTLGMDVKLITICDKGSDVPSHAAIIFKDSTNRYKKCPKFPDFVYCEATSEGWRIGEIPEKMDENSINIIA